MSENSGQIEEKQSGDAEHIDVCPESCSNLAPPADTMCSNESTGTGDRTPLGPPSASNGPDLMSDLAVLCASQPTEANLSVAESKCVTSSQDSSDKSSNDQGNCMEGNAASIMEQKVIILKRKLPADTKREDYGTCSNESTSTGDRAPLDPPSASNCPGLMYDPAVLCASQPTEANLTESKCVTSFQDSSDKSSNAANAAKQKVSILKRKLPADTKREDSGTCSNESSGTGDRAPLDPPSASNCPGLMNDPAVLCASQPTEAKLTESKCVPSFQDSSDKSSNAANVAKQKVSILKRKLPADTMHEDSGASFNESTGTGDISPLGPPAASNGPELMSDPAVLCASQPMEANLSLAESKCVTSSQDSSDKSSNDQGNATTTAEQKVSIPKKKLPDLPADLEPLKQRCTTMSQEVLQLLGQKIKEDIIKTKDTNDIARTQQLRELSWKVTDMLALGSSVVREIENKSAYQLQREREAKKYRNKKNRNWNQPQFDMGHNENQYGDHSRQQNQRTRNDRRGRGRRGRRDYGNRNDSTTDQNWRKPKFHTREAKHFAQFFVKDIISKAVSQLLKEEEERIQLRISKEVDMAVQLVNTIIAKSIQTIIVESTDIKNNLSLTEAELLSDMCEESMCDDESFLMDVSESLSIKTEPTLGG